MVRACTPQAEAVPPVRGLGLWMLVLALVGAFLARGEGGFLGTLGVPRHRRMLYGAIAGAVLGLVLVPVLGLLAMFAYMLLVLVIVIALIVAVYLVARVFARFR
jgi:hypothetical protein